MIAHRPAHLKQPVLKMSSSSLLNLLIMEMTWNCQLAVENYGKMSPVRPN